MPLADHLFWKFGQHFEEDEILFREGEKSDSMYVVVSGEVDILKHSEGRSELVAVLGEGEFFGEMALLTGEPRSATALVREGSRLLVVGRETFLNLLRDSGEVSLLMLQRHAARLGETTERLNESSEALVRMTLIVYVLLKGRVKWPDELSEVARFVGVKPLEANSIVEILVEEGLLEFSRNTLVAKDPDSLMERLSTEHRGDD